MSMWIRLAGNIKLNEPIRTQVKFHVWTVHFKQKNVGMYIFIYLFKKNVSNYRMFVSIGKAAFLIFITGKLKTAKTETSINKS